MLCGDMAAEQPPAANAVVDARGLRCPWPVLRLDRALRDGAAAVDLLSDDAAAAGEIAAYAAERGLDLVVAGGRFCVSRR